MVISVDRAFPLGQLVVSPFTYLSLSTPFSTTGRLRPPRLKTASASVSSWHTPASGSHPDLGSCTPASRNQAQPANPLFPPPTQRADVPCFAGNRKR